MAGDKVRELGGSHIMWDCSPLGGTLAFNLKEREMGCNQEKAGTYTQGYIHWQRRSNEMPGHQGRWEEIVM